MGMVNHLGTFSPQIAEQTQILRELLSSTNASVWNPSHEAAFHKVKSEITKPAILCHYDPVADTTISANASSYGLGAAQLQKDHEGNWRPVAFASTGGTRGGWPPLQFRLIQWRQRLAPLLMISQYWFKWKAFASNSDICTRSQHAPAGPVVRGTPIGVRSLGQRGLRTPSN